jgi:NTE family protein
MPQAITARPDALVLGVGGTLGVAWLRGVLAGLTEHAGIDFRTCEYLVGTSAGSVVAAALAAGQVPRLSGDAPPPEIEEDVPYASGGRASLRAVERWSAALAAPVAPALLRLGAPGGALIRRTALRTGPQPTRRFHDLERYLNTLGSRFDGRLRVVTVDRATGRRVVFGAPGAPPAEVPEAVLASCAIPWVMAPVEIGGREYVDGGLWSPTNLDVVPAGTGTEVLCLVPTASASGSGAPAPLRALRGLSVAAARAESLALKARGARVRVIRPDEASSREMGPNLMDSRRREAVLQAAYAQGRRLAG